MSDKIYKDWHTVCTVELNATAEQVWALVGGFYILPAWHPDIAISEVPDNQASEKEIRRKLTFPGQPPTYEQLVYMDNENYFYKYKWFAGPWGEAVQKYHAQIRVVEMDNGNTCMVQWSSTYYYYEDALS